MRYYIIAGEASGDLHGSNLMKGLYAGDPDAVIRFRGGELMARVYGQMSRTSASNAGLAHDYRSGAVMGVMEVLMNARTLLNSLEDCKEDIFEFSPDVVILIDYPGFNLKIAKWAHNQGMKVFYYIAPKVWASREGRIRQIKRYVDKLFIVFPFEIPYFKKHGVDFCFCGNPLVDAVDNSPAKKQNRDEFLQEIGIHPSKRVIAMLAGSRSMEVKMMMPLFTKTAAILHADARFKDFVFIVAGAPGRKAEDYGSYDESYMKVVFGKTQQIVSAADAAAINSGTASLEAALLGTPQVVAYLFPSRLTYYIARLVVRVKYISLGNLCLDKLAFRELYDYDNCVPEVLAKELDRLVYDQSYRRRMMEDYNEIRKSLGGSGASISVARKMIEELNNSK